MNAARQSLFRQFSHRCDDLTLQAFPLCRLQRNHNSSSSSPLLFVRVVLAEYLTEERNLIYRLESDTQPGNLTGVIDFCAELGGYPIYANNAFQWQLIQG